MYFLQTANELYPDLDYGLKAQKIRKVVADLKEGISQFLHDYAVFVRFNSLVNSFLGDVNIGFLDVVIIV